MQYNCHFHPYELPTAPDISPSIQSDPLCAPPPAYFSASDVQVLVVHSYGGISECLLNLISRYCW